MLTTVICDWNRTLLSDHFEESFFVPLSRGVLCQALLAGRLGRAISLAGVGVWCYGLVARARMSPGGSLEPIRRISELLNRHVLPGLEADRLARYRRRYGARAARRLDRRLLDPLLAIRRERGIRLGVISSGCRGGIEAVLGQAGLDVDFVVANDFAFADGAVTEYELTVMDNKADVLADVLASRQIDPAGVMYIGDNAQDENCLAMVGYPVVSMLARRRERRRLTAQCGAFAPRSQAEFARHLQAAAT